MPHTDTVPVAVGTPRRRASALPLRDLTDRREDSLDSIIRGESIRAVYQPIVHLETGHTVGYEALARGPRGSAFETPDSLFGAARSEGRLSDLDWACRTAALRGVLAHDWPSNQTLFVNVEPATLHEPIPEGLRPLLVQAESRTRIAIELTERTLVRNPPGLLQAVGRMREHGWGIALDDVGAEPASAAMLSILRPDVIKLDLRLIQARHDRHSAAQLTSILAEAERTGAVLLAEGIETDKHARTARGYGAEYGQGWLLGRPADLPERIPDGGAVLPFLAPRVPAAADPMADILARGRSHVATKGDLVAFSRYLERLAIASPDPTVVFAALQHVRHFTPATRRQYADLGAHSPLVGLFGVDLEAEPCPGVRGVNVRPDDALASQWHVVVLGAQFAGALIAEDLGDNAEEDERRFRYRMTFDRETVIEAARSLAVRLPALAG